MATATIPGLGERRAFGPKLLVMPAILLMLAAAVASSIAADRPKDNVERSDPPGNKERLEKARQTVLQMFKNDFERATSPAKKQELARELLENAPRIKDDLEVRYAILTEAKEQAIAAGQIALSLEAIDITVKYFRLDPIELKTAALDRLGKTARDSAGQRDIANAALAVSKTASMDSRFDDAQRLAMLALVSAQKSRSMQLIRQADATLLEIAAAKKKAKS